MAAKVVSNLAAGVCLVIGLAIFTSSLVATSESQILGPIKDFWQFMPLLQAFDRGESLMPLLLSPHGGAHRIVVPRLFFLAEYSFFQGTNLFLMSVGVIAHLILVAVLLRAVQNKRNRLTRTELVFSVGLILALNLSATQFPNFVRPWNVAWYLCATGMIAAFACLIRANASNQQGLPVRAWGWWVGTVVMTWIASYSMANGLLIWPSLLLIGFVMRLPGRFQAGSAIAGVISIQLFDLPPGQHTKLIERADEIISWMLKCLGSPLTWNHETAGLLLAALGTLAAGVLVLRLLMRRTPALPGECLLLGLMVFSWGSVAMIAVGRVQRVWDSPRYQTVVLLFWLSVVLLGVLAFRRSRANQHLASSGVMLIATLWLAGIIFPAHLESTSKMTRFVQKMRTANTAVLMGVESKVHYRVVLPFSDHRHRRNSVASHRVFLEEKRLGVFAHGYHELLSRSLNDVYPAVDEARCRGAVRRPVRELKRKPGRQRRSAQVRGWVAATPGSELEDVLLVASPDGTIVGLARTLGRNFDPLNWRGRVRASFRGYVRGVPGSVDVFAITKSGSVCPIARNVRVHASS